jgi:hypothetical protein
MKRRKEKAGREGETVVALRASSSFECGTLSVIGTLRSQMMGGELNHHNTDA